MTSGHDIDRMVKKTIQNYSWVNVNVGVLSYNFTQSAIFAKADPDWSQFFKLGTYKYSRITSGTRSMQQFWIGLAYKTFSSNNLNIVLHKYMYMYINVLNIL